MPHMPDSQHDTHDLELVAAFAAGDAAGADLETATALVASCADCAALHRDLRAIAAALPTIPAPARPRDFRLSPEQAASLRPRGIRGLLAAFASPRLSFATPVGTGLAAIGIVGVLVASGGLPVGGGATSQNAQAPAGSAPASTLEILLASPAAEDEMNPVLPVAPSAPAASAAPGTARSEAPAEGAEHEAATAAPVPSPASPTDDRYAYSAGSPQPVTGRADAGNDVVSARTADQALLIVAAVTILVGLALIVMRWVSRRIA